MDCGNPSANLTIVHSRYITGSPPYSTRYSAASLIICENTYFFSDGTEENIITCESTGTWTPLPNCICMKTLLKSSSLQQS